MLLLLTFTKGECEAYYFRPHVTSIKSSTLPADRLRGLLQQLNEALTEAERLRDQVSWELDDQRASHQQRLSPPVRRTGGDRTTR